MKRQKTEKNWKRYEVLVILDTAGREDTEKTDKEIIERIQKEIQRAGGKVETIQKMGQKPFARVTRRRSAGSYVNFIFSAPRKAIAELDAKFHLDPDLFRWLFTEAPPREPKGEGKDKDKEKKSERD